MKHSWVVVFLEKLGNQVSLVSDDRLLTCSDLSAQWGVQVSDEYVVGFRPILDSGNRGEMILSGDDISGDTISLEIPDLLRGEGYHVRVSAWNGPLLIASRIRRRQCNILQLLQMRRRMFWRFQRVQLS